MTAATKSPPMQNLYNLRDLRAELARVGKRAPWLHQQLQAAGVKIGTTKLYMWLREDATYAPPTREEWAAIWRILRSAGKGSDKSPGEDYMPPTPEEMEVMRRILRDVDARARRKRKPRKRKA